MTFDMNPMAPNSFKRRLPCSDLHPFSQRPCPGFTLTELLVVMAIIAIMAAMLLPAVGLVKASAKTADCSNRMRQLGLIFSIYVHNNEGTFLGPGPGNSWADYHKNLLEIPTTTGLTAFNAANIRDVASVFMCSEDKYRPDSSWSGALIWDNYISHGYNMQILGGRNCGRGPFQLRDVAKPSDTVLATDSRDNLSPARWDAYLGTPMASSNQSPPAYPRHRYQTQCMVLWLDGRASAVPAAGPGDYTSLYSATRLGQTNWYSPSTNTFGTPNGASMWDTK